MSKYFIIYKYHDLYIQVFDDRNKAMQFLYTLKEHYKFDKDFKYKFVIGYIWEEDWL